MPTDNKRDWVEEVDVWLEAGISVSHNDDDPWERTEQQLRALRELVRLADAVQHQVAMDGHSSEPGTSKGGKPCPVCDALATYQQKRQEGNNG